MRLFAVGDVGGPSSYHLGDEAMLEANVDAFRQIVPGIQFTVMSADPAWTGKRYGVESVSAPRIPSGHTAGSWMRCIVETPGPQRWAESLGDEIVAALRQSDGLFVSGGGNLSATWPAKVLERVALIEQARELLEDKRLREQMQREAEQRAQRSRLRWLRQLASGSPAANHDVPAANVPAK